MFANTHPIFIPDGYQIYTKPTEEFANFIRNSIREDHHGCSAYGPGGVGKSSAQCYLTDNASRWLIDENGRQIGVASRMIMAGGIRRTDGAFWSSMCRRLNLSAASRIPPGVALDRVVNFVCTRCGHARLRLMVLFIDNAQRITDAEYQYLEDLDGLVSEQHLKLFLVLMRQSDSEGIDIGDDWLERPTHTVRRWFMDTMPFRALSGIAEITHALDRYDRWATWPSPDMPFSRYFARAAFDAGWTLASEAGLIVEVMNELRKQYKLEPTTSWPMATFTLVVRHLLTEVASAAPDFRRFTRAQIHGALLASGYLRLEFVLAKMRMPDIHTPSETGEAR